ncbi:hypothetical protein NRL14_16910 [Pseudoalteromonas sp. 20-92]|uniref:hypothetical protein n=1 Tax=Pseudoalteromonas sp. 20-92 TaxID=2969394 RepID=UPI0027B53D80|nr:hypothetical protein [Pseudoalteromonas sp. 20-92]MDQ2045385.1 hypothetical protein [Pseudoalteromonas sp. 20-92]
MDVDKKKFYDVAMRMQANSSILFSNDCNNSNHGSVYLAGYVLEAYIKVLLLNYGETRFYGHVGETKFLEKFKRITSVHPEIADILHESNPLYPEALLVGQDGADDKSSWDVNHRYSVNIWSDMDFCQRVQKEILQLKTALIELRIQGVLS